MLISIFVVSVSVFIVLAFAILFNLEYQLEPSQTLPMLSSYKDEIISSVKAAGEPKNDPRDVALEIQNNCPFPVQVEVINLKSLADRTDGAIAAELARRITFLLKPRQSDFSKEFNEKSGPGVYMVFAVRLSNKTGIEPQWQAIKLLQEDVYSVNLFNNLKNKIVLSEEPFGSGLIKGVFSVENRVRNIEKRSTPPV